jgi:O-antigen/teichoic acid export membrane protein
VTTITTTATTTAATATATDQGTTGSHGSVLMRSMSWLGASQLLTWSGTLLWTLVVPRRLGASQVGIFTLSQASLGILLVGVGLGMQPLLVRRIATDSSSADDLLGTAIVLRALLAVPALGLTLLLVRLGPFHGDEAIALLLAWATCLCVIVAEPIRAGFQALERMRYLAFSSIITNLLVTASAILLVTLGGRAVALLLAGLVINALVTLLNVIWARPYFRLHLRAARPQALRRLMVESLPYWGFVAFFTLYLWIDSFMLAVMTPASVLGWYGLATRLFGTLMFVPMILGTAWLSRLVKDHQAGGDQLMRTARPGIELVMVASMPVTVGAMLVAPDLLRDLFGRGFSGSVPAFILLCLCVPPMYLSVSASQVMVARGQQLFWTKMMGLACIVNPLLNLVLIPYFQQRSGNGAIGAAAAMVVTEVLLATIATVTISETFTRTSLLRFAKGGVATLVMAGVVVGALHVDLFLALLAGVISFSLMVWATQLLTGTERAMLHSLVAGRLRLPTRLTRNRDIRPSHRGQPHSGPAEHQGDF